MHVSPILDAIDREARALPPDMQLEILDFIGFLRMKYQRQSDPGWLDRAWGRAPDFPDRPAQPPVEDIQGF